MSKITITSIFEISKALATKSGQELSEVVEFVADLGEQSLRALRRGLTFRDNFDSEPKVVELINDTDQIISVTKSPVNIWVTRVFTTTNHLISFGWYINNDSRLVVNATFINAPSEAQVVRLMILY